MSAGLLREAAALMRARAKAATPGPWVAESGWFDRECGKCDIETPDHVWHSDAPFIHASDHVVVDEWHVEPGDAPHIASWHPAVALAVAKAMDDVAHAWEIADESADGWVYDADDNHYRFEETVDGGWLTVARAYLGRES